MKGLLFVLALSGLLAGMIALNLRWANAQIDLTPLSARTVADNAPADASIADAQSGLPTFDLEEALQRPLFHADRRPFSPPPPEPTPEPVLEVAPPQPVAEAVPPAPPLEMRLAGVSLSGDQRRALLGPASGADLRWYAEGQSVEGWTLSDISSQDVHFTNGERSVRFKLYPGAQP